MKTPADKSAAAAQPPAATDTPATAARPDPLDHDSDDRKGGSAPAPERQPMVALKDLPSLGLSHGEVILVTPADAKRLLSKDQARNATPTEVELAQPRVREWAA